MKKKSYVFAESKEGELYVKAKAIMNPLCAMFDGLPIVQFGGRDKNIYLGIDTAINWVKQEMQHHSKDKYQKILTNLELAKSKHEAGQMEYTN